MKVLLINPKFPESYWSFSWVLKNVTPQIKTLNSPLGLATLAALSPSAWEIEIVDENVEPIDWMAKADIVGVCGMGVQADRQKEILNHFKNRGIFVVAGGSYASLCPEEYEGLADTVISGESEYIWPKFCEDFIAGKQKSLYRETGTVNLHDSPCPRFDLLKPAHYQRLSLQFSRGCPFQCEFCDIIIMFGRTPRNKSHVQIERELDALRALDVHRVFFVDDNFIGNKKLAKDLLTFLVDYQKRHQYEFSFGTEASVNLADDDTLLRLMREAHFEWVFMGIESPSEESLKETKKVQNIKGDLLTKIQKIYGAGLDILAGFIVGFDSDDRTIFDRQYQFIEASGIIVAMVGLLTALPKTPLYQRLKEAGRLKGGESGDQTRLFTNVVPLQMSSEELIEGYIGLQRRLSEDRSIHLRLSNKIRHLRDPFQYEDLKLRQKLLILSRFLFRGILPGGRRRVYYFARSLWLGLRKPKALPLVMGDWIAGVSLQSFSKRKFEKPSRLGDRAYRYFEESLVLKAYRRLHQEISIKISEWQGREKIWIGLQDQVNRGMVRLLVRSVRGYLKRCQGSIVLDIREIGETGLGSLKLLFARLEKYGSQVHLCVSQSIYQTFHQELSAFQFTLA